MELGRDERRGPGAAKRLGDAITRRTVLKGAGVAGVGALAGRAALLRSAARQSTGIQDVINTAITAEALAVTVLGVARKLGADGKLDLGGEIVGFLRAAQCEEEAHYNFLDSAGAKPATTTFTPPDAIFKDKVTFLRSMIDLETIFVGAYMAAARRLAAAGNLQLVEIAYAIGAVEAQHLSLAKFLVGLRPASDRAFAQWLYTDVSEAAQALTQAGFIGGSGKPYAYPGPVDRFCQGVFGLVPETTPAQTGATPGAAASPPATPASGGPPTAGGTPPSSGTPAT